MGSVAYFPRKVGPAVWRWLPLLGLFALVAGCNNWAIFRNNGTRMTGGRMPTTTPTATELVGYLNDNAHRLQSIDCRDLQLDATANSQTFGLTGRMVCQKPRNFRMHAYAAGMDMADIGSNQDEFWFWIGKTEPPYLYHCSHQDFAQGRSRMRFPFQPDWVMVALGMAEYDPAKQYRVDDKGKTIELVEQTVSAQGQPVLKVTVFSRAANNVQVSAHRIHEMNGKEICSATISQVQQDPASGAVYPRIVQLNWPADRTKLRLRLEDVAVNNAIDQGLSARLFTRPVMESIQSYNLAYGPDAPTPAPLRPAGGYR